MLPLTKTKNKEEEEEEEEEEEDKRLTKIRAILQSIEKKIGRLIK